MRTDAEKNGAVWARANDDRVTRVGRFIRKTRMDEIPQVFNVLLGDMSFVGPRPERPVFVEQLKQQIPFYGAARGGEAGHHRLGADPLPVRGVGGGRAEQARVRPLLREERTLFLDLGIIFHTVRHVLLGRGAR